MFFDIYVDYYPFETFPFKESILYLWKKKGLKETQPRKVSSESINQTFLKKKESKL